MSSGVYSRIITPLEIRFWNKVIKTNHCWIWSGCTVRGYGRVNTGNAIQYAHIVSWELCNGPVPKGMCVCHSCDNPPCVRPEHLFLGSNVENWNDMRNKCRHAHGEKLSKITAQDVIDIRVGHSSGDFTMKELADMFEVSYTNIHAIIQRRSWKHV